METHQILEKVRLVGAEARAYILAQYGKVMTEDIEEKEKNSLVSYVDKETEKLIVDRLKPLILDAGFITEEETQDILGKSYQWVIDPLDGTTNFLNSIPHFAISIALQHNSSSLIGYVVEINSGEEFYAVKNGGAFLNGRRIQVNHRCAFGDLVVATGFPYSNEYDTTPYFEVISHMLKSTRGLRRMGSAALDLCYVAAGRFGAYYESRLNSWDIAAGALIVQEAGGIVCDFEGGENYQDGSEILATTPSNLTEFLPLISPLLKK